MSDSNLPLKFTEQDDLRQPFFSYSEYINTQYKIEGKEGVLWVQWNCTLNNSELSSIYSIQVSRVNKSKNTSTLKSELKSD